jgi:hypothetical protein
MPKRAIFYGNPNANNFYNNMSNKEITKKTVFVRTFGWPLVTVARDGTGCVKEGKWFGVKRLGKIYK